MKELSSGQKRILCFCGLGIMFILMGNSNNSPEVFIQRIFKPISGENWVFYYSGFIVIGGIYYCLYKLNEIKENRLIRTPIRRFISTIVLMSIFPTLWTNCTQVYKGFYKDLNAIYLDREISYMNFNKGNGIISIDGRLYIKNCNNETQEFYIKIKTPSSIKSDIKEDYVTLPEKYIVHPKENKAIYVSQELLRTEESNNSTYMIKGFEYILFNDNDETIFEGSVSDYKYDVR